MTNKFIRGVVTRRPHFLFHSKDFPNSACSSQGSTPPPLRCVRAGSILADQMMVKFKICDSAGSGGDGFWMGMGLGTGGE